MLLENVSSRFLKDLARQNRNVKKKSIRLHLFDNDSEHC